MGYYKDKTKKCFENHNNICYNQKNNILKRKTVLWEDL